MSGIGCGCTVGGTSAAARTVIAVGRGEVLFQRNNLVPFAVDMAVTERG
jgi:hypothetical protein